MNIQQLLLSSILCGTTSGYTFATIQQHAPDIQDQSVEPEATEVLTWEDLCDESRTSGRVAFYKQPTQEEIKLFAEAGGKVIINARTSQETDKLCFDEQEYVESLGLQYVHIPTSSETFSMELRDQLHDALIQHSGSVMFHCGSGSRAAGIYALYLMEEYGFTRKDAVRRGFELGMSNGMARLMEREFMETPRRVINSINAENIQETIDQLVGFGTRHTFSETESESRGIGAARRWVYSQFESNIAGHQKPPQYAPRVYFDSHVVEPDGRRIDREVEVVNVVCEIPGVHDESRDRLYYVLAHLDSRASGAMDAESDAPGANDDGSGIAALLELSRVLSHVELESTIVLIATSGEEQGLFGARLHAQRAFEQQKDIRAILNNDTIGDPSGVLEDQDGRKVVRVFSEGPPLTLLGLPDDKIAGEVRKLRLYGTESDSESRQLARYIADVAKLHRTNVQPKLIFRPDRFLRGGDHTPFNELGYSAVRFCEMYENYDHQHQDVRVEDGVQFGDLPEFVDPEYIADVTKLNAVTLVHLANAPSSPRDSRVLISGLQNETTLRWEPSPEQDVAGYEIVWRETTDSDWKKSEDVGNVTEATVPLSKDNWLFGVRAYDLDGYRSPVSYPYPSRE